METHFPRSHYNPTHTEVTEPLEQEGTGCPWQTCSRDLLRSYNCRRELRESQSYTAWTGPEATGSTPCFGKPLLLIVLMALSPAVPKEQALLTWLCRGRESPTAPTFCCGCPGAQGQLSPGWAQTLSPEPAHGSPDRRWKCWHRNAGTHPLPTCCCSDLHVWGTRPTKSGTNKSYVVLKLKGKQQISTGFILLLP